MAGSSTIRSKAFVFADVDKVLMTTQLDKAPLGAAEFDAVGLFDASDPDAPSATIAKSYQPSSVFTSYCSTENNKLSESYTKGTRPS
jgi:hypothetical protein